MVVRCAQRPGETFAPVARIESIRLLLSVAAERGRKVRMYDVKTAFLDGKLKNEIYMMDAYEYEYGKIQAAI